MSVLEYFSLFFSVIAGGAVAFYFKQSNKQILQMILSFSGAYILAITVLHFLPSVFSGHHHHIGLYILLGFVIQLLLEQLSVGIEHGHIHPAHKGKRQFAIQVMLGLCVHAFIEGLPLGKYASLAHDHHHAHDAANHLLHSIILHKIPAAFALVILFLLSNFSKTVIVICMILFAAMSPLGSMLGEWLDLDVEKIRILLAIVVGSFLHIATTILFEIDGTNHHRISWKKLAAIIGGMALALFSI